MDNDKKQKIKNAFIVLIKACIPAFIAFLSSVATTLIGGDVGTSTTVGTVLGITSGILTKA